MKKAIAIFLTAVLMVMLMSSALAASITITPNVPADGTDTSETYKAYKIFSAEYEGDGLFDGANISYTIDSANPFFTAIQNFKNTDGGAAFNLTQVNSTSTYIVTKTGDYDAADLAEALKGIAATPDGVSVYANGKYTISGLDKGYYFVTSTLGSKIIVDTLDNIEINTKNQYPSLSKTIVDGENEVDSVTAERGNDVNFRIDVTIPETAFGKIVVHDKMDANLTFKSMTAVEGITKTAADETQNPCSFHFELSAEYVKANLGKTVSINYVATLNTDAPFDTSMKNISWLTYSEFTSKEDEVEVYTYQLEVFKYSLNDGTETGLAGAGFVLKNADGKYYKNASGAVSWVDSEADATEYKTEAPSYLIAFTGLKNGIYTLHEKTVPKSFNPAQDVEIKIENSSLSGENRVEVLNETGHELPSTGGVGTTVFYIAGAALMLGAAVLLVARKKASASEE